LHPWQTPTPKKGGWTRGEEAILLDTVQKLVQLDVDICERRATVGCQFIANIL